MQPDNTVSRSQKHALDNVQQVDESSPQSGASKILCKSELSIHTVNYIGSPVEIQIPTRWSLIGRTITNPPHVVAQQ
jgi:hypothetical protein